MAIWKVIADKIQLSPHPTSDRLMVGKVGKFQIVVNKTVGYKDGDVVVFAPERSILPKELLGEYVNTDTGVSYLQGENHDRVGAVRLRGEPSEGVTLPLDWVKSKLASGGIYLEAMVGTHVDLSQPLGITKYTPTIPDELVGKISHMNETMFETRFIHHDVELFNMFKDEFTEGEECHISEKVNGSQVNVLKDTEGNITLSSKYLGHDGFVIDEDFDNKYWQAVYNSGLNKELVSNSYFHGCSVQVIAEMIPVAKGFNYGQSKPTLRVFKLIVDGYQIPIREILGTSHFEYFQEFWVPSFGYYPFDPSIFQAMADGRERVSGKQLHIREGIVIVPVVPRNDSEGHGLAVKYLNSKYKPSSTEIA